MDPNSMLYWWPAVQKVGAPTPRTIIVEAGWDKLVNVLDGKLTGHEDEFRAAANGVGYPLFLRTDQASGKHHWTETCYVPDESNLLPHIFRVIEENELADVMGLNYEALIFREFLPLHGSFTAFTGMPVSREWRAFAADGHLLCQHFYWPEEALKESWTALPDDWRERWLALQDDQPGDEVWRWAEAVTKELGGAWSVDFAQHADGRWFLIDMAEAKRSWHPDHAEAG